jgi:hypothetical protein
MGMEFMLSFAAVQTLESGMVVGMNPVITMLIKEKTRMIFPSQAAWSHQISVRGDRRGRERQGGMGEKAGSLFNLRVAQFPSFLRSPNAIHTHTHTHTNTQDVITLGAVASDKQFTSVKEVAAFLADEIRAITGVSDILTTAQLTSLGLDSLGFVEVSCGVILRGGCAVSIKGVWRFDGSSHIRTCP